MAAVAARGSTGVSSSLLRAATGVVGEEEDGDEAVGMVRFFGFLEAAGAVKEAGKGKYWKRRHLFIKYVAAEGGKQLGSTIARFSTETRRMRREQERQRRRKRLRIRALIC